MDWTNVCWKLIGDILVVQMEALTAASTALLTVWDMVKAVAGKEMIISDLMVVHKEGGKSGDWSRVNGFDGMDVEYEL